MALTFAFPKHLVEVQTFYVIGQGVNETQCGVKLTHKPSGAVGICSDERRQSLNKRRAFERLTETKEFQTWHMQQAIEIMGI